MARLRSVLRSLRIWSVVVVLRRSGDDTLQRLMRSSSDRLRLLRFERVQQPTQVR